MRHIALYLTSFLALAAPAIGQAADSHTLTIQIERSTALSVEGIATELVFPTPGPGQSFDGVRATGQADVGYTASGESALMVEIDRDPLVEAGIGIVARPSGSSCGESTEVRLAPFAQQIVALDPGGTCAETLNIDYEGTVEDPSALTDGFIGVVTYTLL